MTAIPRRGFAALVLLGACGQPASIATANDAAPAAPAAATLETVASNAMPSTGWSTAAPNTANDTDGQQNPADINGNVIASLKSELVGKGKVDGKPITDVQARGSCRTAFVAGDQTVVIDWAKAGNFAGRTSGGTATLPIEGHDFTMPETPTFARVDGSFGLLADNCER